MQGLLLSGSRTPQCLLGSNILPDILLYGLLPLVPFCCFLSRDVGGAVGGLSTAEGEGEGEEDGRLSTADGEEDGRRSGPEGDAAGRLSGPEGVMLGSLPFRTRSKGLWGGLSVAPVEPEEDEDDDDEDVLDEQLSLMGTPSLRPRQGIFSRLTTGTDTHGRPRAPLGG